jgi:NAD(P)-dependent dehydrogenase (short-subunit alcohol dehydrogenase family)
MKTVIITGAGGNLGKETVKKFLEAGYHVVTTITQENELEEFKDNPDFKKKIVNALSEEDCEAFVKIVIEKRSSIDAAVLLIGGYADGTIETTGEKELQKMFALNFNTAYFMARPIFRQMLKQSAGGRIVFISAAPALSDAAGYPMIGYAIAKSMVLKLARILNNEGQKKNIHCSVVAPTTIDTPQNRTSMPDADFSKWTKAEEIATVLEFICSSKGDKMKDVVIKM